MKQEATSTTAESPTTTEGDDNKHALADSDFSELDDYERVVFDHTVIFKDEHGQDESQESRALRFKLTQALTYSLPHHQHKLVTWTEGNNYQLITLVLVDIKHTKRSLYNVISELTNIKFEQNNRVDDVINKLHSIQLRANRISPNAITTDVIRGALLTTYAKHPDFRILSDTLSRPGDTHTYHEICTELHEHESNIMMTHSKASKQTSQTFNIQQLPDTTLTALLTTLQNQLQSKTEVCRNYLHGRCRNKSSCPRLHPPGQEGSKKREKGGGRPGSNSAAVSRKCFNCVEPGHFARDCPKPKRPR